MATLLHRIGAAAFRHRVAMLGVWLVLLIGTGVGAATLSGKTVSTFEIPGQESTTALNILEQRFGEGAAGATAQVVLQAPAGQQLTTPQNTAAVARTVTALTELPGVVSASDPLDPNAPVISQDRRTVYSTVSYGMQSGEITEDQRDALLGAVDDARAAGLTAEVTGDATQGVPPIGGPAEVIGVIVALAVLAVTYGSLVAAGMNLLTAIVGVGIGALTITTLTGFVDLQSTTPILALMLGLAVGIDYALFIVTRFRQELLGGRSTGEAAATAVGTAGSAVVTAGATVVIALAGLSVAGIPFLTEMGLAAAGTVVAAVLIAITLVPAALGFIGLRALPRSARRRIVDGQAGVVDTAGNENAGRVFTRWADVVTKQRVVSLLAAVIALGVIAIPVASLRTTLATPVAEDTTQGRASDILADSFGPGFAGPLLVLVTGDDAEPVAGRVGEQAAALSDVAAVAPPVAAPEGGAALLTIIPKSAPDSVQTEELVAALREGYGSGSGADNVYVTGQTAIGVDVSAQLDKALPIYLLLVVGLALVLLILVFRSILVPVVGVLGFLLTVGASFGATVAVFQWGWLQELVHADGTGPLLSLMPIIVIGILFGLAMDYQVFLVSRMHEAHAHGAEPLQAIRTGFRQAAPVVLAAAAIMFAVFAGFVPEGDATIKPIAFSLAIGIVFDAVLVRMVIMPAALALLGRSAWWLPGWLSWLPVLDVEGTALEKARPDVPGQRAESPSESPERV